MTRDIVVTAPVRIADLGGWTDTWFAGHGAVCHLAVRPGITVRLSARPASGGPAMVVDAPDVGERYVVPGSGELAARHPLLSAAIAASAREPGRAYHLRVSSGVPPGAATGTSAAVVVAILAAFDAAAGRTLARGNLARRAHAVEVESAGQESGVQDQIAAAHGGANFIEIPRYPESHVERLALSPATRRGLDARVLVAYLGRAHDSSAVHREVIAALATPGHDRRLVLEGLRAAAHEGRAALLSGDLDAYGRALSNNCALQASLHPGLVSRAAADAMALARAHGAVGWKVNGAGGDGGSVTVLCGAGPRARAELAAAMEAQAPGTRVLPLMFSPAGVQLESAT